MNPFLLVLLVVYAMGFSAAFVLIIFMESLGGSMGRAFGYGSRKTPSWQMFLYALVWPVFLVGVSRR